MLIEKNMRIDFAQRGLCQQIHVVQGDCLSRSISFSLYENGIPWEVPSGVTPALRYGKSDGTGGVYDTLPDGNSAWFAEGNRIGMILAPQVMSVPGLVQCQLMLVKDDIILGSFTFHIIVDQDPAYDAVESKGYFSWSKVIGNFVMAPEAKVGDYIRVKAVDATGIPTQWEAVSPDSSQNGDGLSDTAKTLLISILRDAVYSTDQSANITALEKVLAGGDVPDIPDEPVNPEKTLTSISAVYSGGDVTAGTAVSALTGIVVTAHYSDGTSATVTGYTLSGTIAEGSNTITVSYGGKTATFTVTGVAEGSGDDDGKVYITDSLEWETGYYFDNYGLRNEHQTMRTSQYVDVTGYSIVAYEDTADKALLTGYATFWDANKTFISRTGRYYRSNNTNYPSPLEIEIPENAVYVRLQSTGNDIDRFAVYLK